MIYCTLGTVCEDRVLLDGLADTLGCFHPDVIALYPCSVEDRDLAVAVDVARQKLLMGELDHLNVIALDQRSVNCINYTVAVNVAQ